MIYEIKGKLSCIAENVPLVTGYHRYVVMGPEKPQAVQIQIQQEQGTVFQMFYGRSPALYLGKEVEFKEDVSLEGTVKTFKQTLTCEDVTLEGLFIVDLQSLENSE